jgi:predicted transcriptional regulator
MRDVVAGRRRRMTDDPDIWFSSVESFAKVLSEKNCALLALIAERRPDSIESLATESGRAKSNLSRTLHTMERYGLVRLEKERRPQTQAGGNIWAGGTDAKAGGVRPQKLAA